MYDLCVPSPQWEREGGPGAGGGAAVAAQAAAAAGAAAAAVAAAAAASSVHGGRVGSAAAAEARQPAQKQEDWAVADFEWLFFLLSFSFPQRGGRNFAFPSRPRVTKIVIWHLRTGAVDKSRGKKSQIRRTKHKTNRIVMFGLSYT